MERWDEALEEKSRETAHALADAALASAPEQPATGDLALQEAPEDPLGFGPIDESSLSLRDASFKPSALPHTTRSAARSAAQTRRRMRSGDASEAATPTRSRAVSTAGVSGADAEPEDAEAALPTSEHFKPYVYLRTFHSNRSFDELQRGLEALRRAQAVKSGQLQDAVKQHFKRFVDLRDTMSQVHSQLQANERSTSPDAPASAQLENSIQRTSHELESSFTTLFNWQEQVNERRQAAGALESFKWLFHLPRRLKEHVRKGEIESVCREYSHACNLLHSDAASIVRRVLAVATQEVDALCEALRNALLDPRLNFEDVRRIVDRLRELESLRTKHDMLLSIDHGSSRTSICTPRMADRSQKPPDKSSSSKLDPTWALLCALQRCVEDKVEQVSESVNTSLAQIEGAMHARKRSVERWQSESAELSTRQRIDFDKLLGITQEGSEERDKQQEPPAASESSVDSRASGHMLAIRDHSAADAWLRLVFETCASLRSLLPRMWSFVLNDQLHEMYDDTTDSKGRINTAAGETAQGTPFATRKSRFVMSSSKPGEAEVSSAVSATLTFACERIKV